MKHEPKTLWRTYVVPSLGRAAARKFKGPHKIIGEGRDAIALTARWYDQPVVVKIIFDERDYWMATDVLEAGEQVGVALVFGLGEWIEPPTTHGGYGIVIQERAWTPAQIQGNASSPFTFEQATRLMRAADALDAAIYGVSLFPDAKSDPFYKELDVGLDVLSDLVTADGMTPRVGDLHANNVGLVLRDGKAEAAIIDFGVVDGIL